MAVEVIRWDSINKVLRLQLDGEEDFTKIEEEASTLRLPPGQWPNVVIVNTEVGDQNLVLQSVDRYGDRYYVDGPGHSARRVVIYND